MTNSHSFLTRIKMSLYGNYCTYQTNVSFVFLHVSELCLNFFPRSKLCSVSTKMMLFACMCDTAHHDNDKSKNMTKICYIAVWPFLFTAGGWPLQWGRINLDNFIQLDFHTLTISGWILVISCFTQQWIFDCELTTMMAIIGPMNDQTVPEFVDSQHLIVITYTFCCIIHTDETNCLHCAVAIILKSDTSRDSNYWNR